MADEKCDQPDKFFLMYAGGGRGGSAARAVTTPEPSARQLQSFLVLSEVLHFGQAAARLFITQSALSQQVRTLEKRLGVELFDRAGGAVALTPAGRNLLPEVRAVVEGMARLRRSAAVHRRHLSGVLTVGTVGAEGAMPLTGAILREVRERNSEMTLRLVNLDFVNQFRAVQSREVDVAFLRAPAPEGIELLHLTHEPRVVCLPSDSPLTALPRITLSQLADHPVVDVPEGTSREWWSFWAADPRPGKKPVRYGPPVADMEALFHAVAQGAGIAFLPSAARDFFPRPGISYREISDLSPCVSVLAWAAGRRREPVVAAVRQAAHRLRRREGQPPDS